MSGEADLRALVGDAALDAVYAHAESGYPEEVCGFLIGTAEGGFDAQPCINRQNALHADDPQTFPRDARTAYNLGPKDVLFLSRSIGSARPVRIIYHSHVDVGAYFSDEDVRAAAPDGELSYPVDYLVVDVQKSGARAARLFRFVAATGAFAEVARHTR